MQGKDEEHEQKYRGKRGFVREAEQNNNEYRYGEQKYYALVRVREYPYHKVMKTENLLNLLLSGEHDSFDTKFRRCSSVWGRYARTPRANFWRAKANVRTNFEEMLKLWDVRSRRVG